MPLTNGNADVDLIIYYLKMLPIWFLYKNCLKQKSSATLYWWFMVLMPWCMNSRKTLKTAFVPGIRIGFEQNYRTWHFESLVFGGSFCGHVTAAQIFLTTSKSQKGIYIYVSYIWLYISMSSHIYMAIYFLIYHCFLKDRLHSCWWSCQEWK